MPYKTTPARPICAGEQGVNGTMVVRELSREAYEQVLSARTAPVPVEQLPVWLDYQKTIEGRSPWGYCSVESDGQVIAAVAFSQFETHGYRFLRAPHGPVWIVDRTPELERAVLEAISAYVRGRDRKQVFMRMAVETPCDLACPVLSTLPYDTTVVIDLTGGDDEILARMKPRGRRDVRKALRECPAQMADETARAAEDFSEYYQVMRETGSRDGFAPAPCADYQNMVRILGAEHCRVLAARVDGKVVAWSLLTISGALATRYYAATAIGSGRLRVADALLFFECQQAAELGCTAYDLMAIGSDFQPELKNLNEFKTKFAKEGVRAVAPDRDVPLKKAFYTALVKARGLRSAIRKAR